MASKEMTPERRENLACFPSVEAYNDSIDKVNDLLLYRQFEDCLGICREQAAVAKNHIEDPK